MALAGTWIFFSVFFLAYPLTQLQPMSLGQTGEAAGAGPAGVVASIGSSGVENTSYFAALA